VNNYFTKLGEFGPECVPDPDREVFERGIFKAGDIIQIAVVELLDDFLGGFADFGVIVEPTHVWVHFSFHGDFHAETMAVHPSAFVPGWHMGQGMRGFKGKIFGKLDSHNYYGGQESRVSRWKRKGQKEELGFLGGLGNLGEMGGGWIRRPWLLGPR